MFSLKDMEIMTIPYFTIIQKNDTKFEIQSVCTGHYWAILMLKTKKRNYFRLLHKYRKDDNYHYQIDCMTVLDAVLEIMCHDDYKLHRRSSHFEETLQRFS